MKLQILCLASSWLIAAALAGDSGTAARQTAFASKPLGIRCSVKMVGPYQQAGDLQIICLSKHRNTGDIYQGAARETDERLGGILSALRNRGEFTGELGETLSFVPPKNALPAKRFMIIGLGAEENLSLDSLRLVGRVAAREAVRLRARHIAWAPVIRDEGNATLDVGAGDRAFIEQLLLAYDTEKRLQGQGLAARFSIEEVVVEAGPAYFDSAVKQVGEGIVSTLAELNNRESAPYTSIRK